MMIALGCLFILGWAIASILGTYAYFANGPKN